MGTIKLKELANIKVEGSLNVNISIGDKFKVLKDVYLFKLPQYSKESWNYLGRFEKTFKNFPILPKGATFEISNEFFSELTGGTYELKFLEVGIITSILFKRTALETCIDSKYVKNV